MNSRKKIVIFQCNRYNHGNGDIGNLIDVAKEVINHFRAEHITPYFIITAEKYDGDNNALAALEESVKQFNEESKYEFAIDVDKQVFSFTHTQCEGLIDNSLAEFIEGNKSLKEIYANADIIFTVSTPFPELTSKEKYLKKNVEIYNITQHCNASLSGPAWSYPHLHHYVTGISKYDSGLMVRDKSCDSVQALKSITDLSYLEKLGLSMPLTDEAASHFIKSTLVVPVYLGEDQKSDLAPLVHLVSQSSLARKFQKIIFHVNKRVYDEELYNEMNATLSKKPETPLIQLIVGHYFENPNDFVNVFQLSSGRGVAIVSSDKVLELAISCDLLPLYPPVACKRPMHRSLHELVHDDHGLNKLYTFLGKTSALKKNKMSEHQTMIQDMQNDDSIADSLTSNTIYIWSETKRPQLLKMSFYNVLHDEILDHKPPYELELKSKNALKLFQKEIFTSKFKFKEGYLTNIFEVHNVNMGPMKNTVSSWAKKVLDEMDAAQKGKQTYVCAFINALIVIILSSENKDDVNAEIGNNMLDHMDLDIESALFAVKNYLSLSLGLTGISDETKNNLSQDWMTELKFIWTRPKDEQVQCLKKVVIWANQLPENSRYGVMQCICRELNLSEVAMQGKGNRVHGL